VNAKSVAGWLAIAFVAWWLITNPTGAAHIVHNFGAFLSTAAHSISTFFTSI
jgi:hypothetical protein